MKRLTVLLLTFISFDLVAQNFSMIKEINTTATTSSIGSTLLQRVGATVYFVANDGISGNELWKSDGTAAGTMMVKDIAPGATSTTFSILTAGNGMLFFVANDGVNGIELWRTDGTNAGTIKLRNFSTCTNCINRLFFHNGLLFFEGDDGVAGLELWKSDGTIAGTVMVKDIFPGSGASSPTPFSNPLYTMVAMGNDVYFAALDPVAGRELFKSDGTEAGTMLVKDIPGGSIGVSNHKAAVYNGKLYYVGADGVSGSELWATDGTEAGTYMVKDIVPGSGNSFPNNLIAFNGALYFTASSTNNAIPDLWKTDGTEAGTVLVRNLVADGITLNIGNSTVIDFFTVANGKLFFRGNGPNGIELYATDGTTAGTGIVKDIYPGLNGVNLNSLFEYNNNVYFVGTDVGMPSRGNVLYKSDGTASGTVQVTDGESGGALGLSSITMTSAGGRLFFWGNTNDNGIELWSTDGTNANTALVKDINTIKTGTTNSGSSIFGTLVHNGYYYYAAVDNTHGNELWKSDGTTAGTLMLKDIWPGKAPSNPSQFFVYNGAIYFMASDGLSGTELWKTDGTEAGTVLVADINPGPVHSTPNRFFISNNYLYFTAYHTTYGIELWRTDGTAAGTALVLDLVTGPANGTSSIIDVVSLNNTGYAIMNIAAGNVLGIPSGSRLIKIDGASNTISDFASFVTAGIDLGIAGNTLYITGRNSSNQTLLWKSENGGAVTQVKILSTTATNAFQLTYCGGKLYFTASNGAAAGMEPWVSDGTDAGTFMIKDISPGANNSTPNQYVYSGGKVYFSASAFGNVNGEYELWATDGTTAGTYLVKDILPGSTGSRPNGTISAFGNKVLFTANDGISGYELWQSDGTAAGTFLLQEFNSNGDGIVPFLGVSFNFPADFVYSKLGDKIVFFARSADKGLQLYSGSIASPYKYVNDNSTTNDLLTTAVGNNANNGSQSAPFATLTYALSQASEGDTIYVDAGLYTEQVTIDKGITLIGAGSGLTIVWKPAVINPPPGPFTEPGTIQTAQNIGDVHIRDMSVTGDNNGVTPIILLTGGSVKYCRLIDGNQGIFFRVNPAIKTAVIENNYISVQYIGINCQGSGLTATLTNNTIDLNNPFFAAGVYAGLDFGPLVRFTAFGNMINNYNAQGILANSYNTNITQNSILGTGQHAIEQGINSLAFATCNWFGTTNAATIASKVSGLFSYTPYLTNGTNTNTTYGNYSFVPVAGACGEGINNFYVNDNSRTNDVFTTAAGSNSNPGTSVAPFATLSYAISVAPANSVIHVDAGTYAEQVIIDKGIVINGAGRELTNFVKPAAALVPAPGPFTEIGLIETTQGITDVHIRNISVNSVDGTSQNIIIQSGGSVKNCKLLNGGQGVFFRIASGARNANVEFNIIQPNGIGVNCQGAGLTATIVNNTISKPGGYYSGIFAGLDFGSLPQLTITNNSISDYFSIGILANANSSNVTNNSIAGTQGIAIQGNALNATCNWYGSNTPAIAGPVIYSPFLINGTDNDIYNQGFQPVPGSCIGIQHRFYVNDNSNIGNVFTTAVGDDNNSGAPSAPLLTLNAALTKASAGDTIFVDAGTYATPNLSITKAVTILGSNYNASPNNPADRLTLNPVRNADALITGSTFTIASNDVRLEGLTFNPGAKAQANMISTGVNNFTFKRNYSIITSGGFLNLNGPVIPSGQVPAFGNYLVEDNRFESQCTVISTCIMVSALNDVTVNNNTFITPATSTQRMLSNSNISGSGGGLTVNYIYMNNISYASRNEWFSSGYIASARIENNISLHGQRSLVIQLSNSTSSDIQVRNNYIETNFSDLSPIQYLRSGTASPGALANLLIENNTIIQNPAGRTSVPAGILAANFFTGSTPSTTIHRNKISFTGDYGSFTSSGVFGISHTGSWQNINLEENEIAFNGTNLTNTIPASGQSSSGISISSDNGTNSIPANAVVNITGNKVNGFRNSFAVYDASSLAPNTYVGYGNLPAGVNVTINNNSFTGDVMSINNGTTSQTVNANCNWYGSAAAQTVATKVTASTVNYTPWLNNGTDNDPATGFQPLPGSCTGTAVTVVVDQSTNVNCNGANNGSIGVTVSGGTTPYIFAWTKDNVAGFSSTEDLNGIGGGIYQLTVTDANGSVATTIAVIITEPAVLTASANGTNVNCFGGSDGSATVIATGGMGSYTYIWSNGATTQSITGLVSSTYSVTVTDANGCIAVAGYQITQPTQLAVTLTGTSASCNGSVTAHPSGGTAPYSYLWNNGATTQSINSVPAGTYSVTVTDAHNCTVSRSFTIAGNSTINPVVQLIQVACFGQSTGRITVTGAGGTAPHTYNLNGGIFQSSNVFNNLPAGVYVIGAKDANGCADFVSKTITQRPLLNVVLDSIRKPCGGVSNGRIYITVTGGTGNRTHSWTGPNGYTSIVQDPNNIAPGNYSVIVTDNNGCTTSLNVTLPEWPVVTISEVVTNVACRNEFTGAINVTVTGGTGSGFTYSWTGPNQFTANTQDISNIRSGTYWITVTDAGSGCSLQKNMIVTQPASNLNLATAKTNVLGCNTPATITATGSGGTAPYQYSLDGINYQSSGLFTGLSAVVYTVWVKDANECTTTKVVSNITDSGSDEFEGNNSKNQAKAITIGTAIFARIAVATDVADWFRFTTPAGSANYILTLTHPSASFIFNVYTAGTNTPALVPVSTTSTTKEYALNGNTTYFISVTGGLSYTCYELSVTSPLSFAKTNEITIDKPESVNDPLPVPEAKEFMSARVYPNPHQGSFKLAIESPEDGTARIELFAINGQKLALKTVPVQKGKNIIPFTGVGYGTIFYRVQIGKQVANGKVIGTN